jgi:hypothetical protein
LWFYFHLWGLAAEYIRQVSFKDAVTRLQRQFPADNQLKNSSPSAALARMERVWPEFRKTAGSLAGPPTLHRAALRKCDADAAVAGDRTVTLVIENRGTAPVRVVSAGRADLNVDSGSWRKAKYRVGEQVRIGESCATVADQHTLAVVGGVQ